MNPLKVTFYPVVIFFLLSVSCLGIGPEDVLARSPVETIAIIREKSVDFEKGRIVSLSPDGGKLVVVGDGVVTVHDAVTLREIVKRDFSSGPIEIRTIAWSPDGRFLALTEDFPGKGYESDIWLLDLEKKTLVDLTNDGLQGPLPEDGFSGKPGAIDLSPVWSRDGGAILFVRQTFDDRTSRFFRLDLGDSRPKELLPVGPDAVRYGVFWFSDKNRILFNRRYPDQNDPNNGIWISDLKTGNMRQVAGIHKQYHAPVLKEVSADGEYAIICYTDPFLQGTVKAKSFFYLLDLATGDKREIVSLLYGELTPYSTQNAVFSPDGGRILIAFQGNKGRYHLAIQDRKRKKEKIILSSEERWGTFSFFWGKGICWASNGSIFVRYDLAPNRGKILFLGVK